MIVQLQSTGPLTTLLGLFNVNVEWSLANTQGVMVQQTKCIQNNTTLLSAPGFGSSVQLAIIFPPAGNTQLYQVKGTLADTGVVSAATLPCMFAPVMTGGAPQIQIGLAAGTDRVFTVIWV